MSFLFLLITAVIIDTFYAGCEDFPGGNKLVKMTTTPKGYADNHHLGACLFKYSDQKPDGPKTAVATDFSLKEFQSTPGSIIRLSPKIVECLQAIRTDLGEAVKCGSGYRSIKANEDNYEEQREKCYTKNKCNDDGTGTCTTAQTKAYCDKRHKTTNSKHSAGTACDTSVAGIASDTNKMLNVFGKSAICKCRTMFKKLPGRDIGLGLDGNNIHIDMRKSFFTWTYPSGEKKHHKREKDGSWRKFVLDTYKTCDAYNAEGTHHTTSLWKQGKAAVKKGWEKIKTWWTKLSSGKQDEYNQYVEYDDQEQQDEQQSLFVSILWIEIVLLLFLCVICGCIGGVFGAFVGSGKMGNIDMSY